VKQREHQEYLRLQIEDNKKRRKEERDVVEGIEIKATLESLSVSKVDKIKPADDKDLKTGGLTVPPVIVKGRSDPNMGYNEDGKREKEDAWRAELQAQIEEKKKRVENEKRRIEKEDAALEKRQKWYQNGAISVEKSVGDTAQPGPPDTESIPGTVVPSIEQTHIYEPKPPTTTHPTASRIPRFLMSQRKATAQQDFTKHSITLPTTPRILRAIKTPPKHSTLKEYPRGKLADYNIPSPPTLPRFQRMNRQRVFQPKKNERPPIIPFEKGCMKRQEKVLPPIARTEIVIGTKEAVLRGSYDLGNKRNNEKKVHDVVKDPSEGPRGQAYRKMKLRIADRDSIKSRESDKDPIDPASLQLVQQLMQFKNVLEQEEVRMSVALESK
jgi:hypothetical protein